MNLVVHYFINVQNIIIMVYTINLEIALKLSQYIVNNDRDIFGRTPYRCSIIHSKTSQLNNLFKERGGKNYDLNEANVKGEESKVRFSTDQYRPSQIPVYNKPNQPYINTPNKPNENVTVEQINQNIPISIPISSIDIQNVPLPNQNPLSQSMSMNTPSIPINTPNIPLNTPNIPLNTPNIPLIIPSPPISVPQPQPSNNPLHNSLNQNLSQNSTSQPLFVNQQFTNPITQNINASNLPPPIQQQQPINIPPPIPQQINVPQIQQQPITLPPSIQQQPINISPPIQQQPINIPPPIQQPTLSDSSVQDLGMQTNSSVNGRLVDGGIINIFIESIQLSDTVQTFLTSIDLQSYIGVLEQNVFF